MDSRNTTPLASKVRLARKVQDAFDKDCIHYYWDIEEGTLPEVADREMARILWEDSSLLEKATINMRTLADRLC